MIRRITTGAVASALVLSWAPAATAADDPQRDLKPEGASLVAAKDKGVVLDLGTGTKPELYIVQLDLPAVPSRSAAVRKDEPSINKMSESSYEGVLQEEQADLISSISRVTGAPAQVRFRYTKALNGVAVRLTRAQALEVSELPGVTAVQRDFTRELHTDNGPAWIGAPSVYDGSAVPGGTGSKGEGVVVGVLDTGLNPANESFADVADDGYDHTNPFGAGNYVGACDPANTAQYVADWGCNDKVIGYWDFDVANNDDGDYDDDGHGSHTASTAAGNYVEGARAYSAKGTKHEFFVERNIQGVAPHANIISYDVCDGAGCQGSSILAALEQVIDDGVDVINYSIGADAGSSPWTELDTLAFLNVRAAGIDTAASAGNNGPRVASQGSPSDAPWMTSTGALTHDRKYVASVVDITAGAATLPDIEGAGLAGPSGTFPVVDAATINNNPLCEIGKFPAGTNLAGKIIVCTRGTTGRVEKGEVVAGLGAEGMILANDQASGDSLNGDAHALPAAHITYADGVALKAFLAANPGTTAALSGSVLDEDPANGDVMAAFSSRGPNRAVSLIGPTISAPGVDILAAAGTDNAEEWHFISGTSMASPHMAGVYALLASVQSTWSPAEVQSAVMTTSKREVKDYDGTQADWFDMGSGRVDLTKAAKAGLVQDITPAEYLAADPAKGGDVRDLNTASMADNDCLQTCSWTRTFEATSTGAGTWNVSVENPPAGVTYSVDKSSFTLAAGEKATVTVTANVADDADTDTWLFGALVLDHAGDAPTAHLPLGVLPSAGVLPDRIDITTRRDAGSEVEKGLKAKAISALQVAPSGLVPGARKALSIQEDTTNGDAFDGNGTHVEKVTVPAGATRLLARLEDPTAPDFDVYVGRGEVSEANVECMSATSGSNEVCEVANPEAGEWWVLVQNWDASTADGTDTTDLVTAVVAGDAGNMKATGPTGALPAATPFDLRVFWDEPAMEAGQTWFGSLTLGSAAGKAGDIGVIPVEIHRIADDVTKSADKATAAPGDEITYTVEIAPNVSREDLAYTITDSLPEGTTYVEGSATDGATYANGTVTWEGTMESSYGEQGTYDITSSKNDPSCVNPLTGTAAYLDLYNATNPPGQILAQSGIVGDTDLWTAFASTSFGWYGESYRGLNFTDDGYLVYGGAGNWAQTNDDEPWTPQVLPNPALPNNVAAGMWRDGQIFYDQASNTGVSIASAGAVKIIEWDNWGSYNKPGDSLDMQVYAVEGSNDLVWVYNDIKADLSQVTIGTENATGTNGQALVNKASATTAITNNTVVCMTYQSAMGDPKSFSYQVKVGDGFHERQVVTNTAVHTVDNPGAKPAEATSQVTIKGAKERSEVALAISPDRIQTGGTTTATATVFSASEAAPTGTVEFWNGATKVGQGTIGAGNKATATLSGFTTAGVFPITAKYLGDATNHGSTSAPVNLVVEAPGQPQPKVGSKIDIVKPDSIRKGKRAKVQIFVTAPKVTPTGTVKITVSGAVKKKTYTVKLDQYGKAKVKLAKARKVGKIKIKVVYSGDAAVRGSMKKAIIRVTRR